MRSASFSSPTFVVPGGSRRCPGYRTQPGMEPTWATQQYLADLDARAHKAAAAPPAYWRHAPQAGPVDEPATHITEIGLCREPVSAELAANVDSTPTARPAHPPGSDRRVDRLDHVREAQMTTTLGDTLTAAASGPDNTSDQVEMVLDLEVGDYLPQFEAAVSLVDIRTERLGVQWVDLELTNGQTMTLNGHDDIAIGPRIRSSEAPARPERDASAFEVS